MITKTGASEMHLEAIHRFLSQESSWAKGIAITIVEKSLQHSLCFGGFIQEGNTPEKQIAFARVISDQATFANLVDVFVLPEYRGLGYSKQLMQAVMAHPEIQGLRRFMLATKDAHGLYAQFGFTPPLWPETLMERYRPDIYKVPL